MEEANPSTEMFDEMICTIYKNNQMLTEVSISELEDKAVAKKTETKETTQSDATTSVTKQLKDLRRKAIRRFYLRPRYVFNQIMAVKSFSEVIKLFIGFWKLLAKFVLRRTTTSKTSFGDLTLESKLDSILED